MIRTCKVRVTKTYMMVGTENPRRIERKRDLRTEEVVLHLYMKFR